MNTREKQVITQDDVGVLGMSSELVTKATAAVQKSARDDMDKPDKSLSEILAQKENKDDDANATN